MEGKVDIGICLGSACFARGNNQTRLVIDRYIRNHGLYDKVNFHGIRCLDHCKEGPVLNVNGTIYEQVNEQRILDILDKVFNADNNT